MNYNELTINLQDVIENTFTADQLALFTKQAEQKIYNAVQIAPLRKNVTGPTTPNNQYMSTPTDFLSVYSVAVIDSNGNYEYLLNKDVNFIRQAYPSPNDTGLPRYYAIFGPTTTSAPNPAITNELSLIFGPTPNAVYNIELHYFYYPESIVTAGTTWLGDNFDSVLLNGTLVEAARFIKADVTLIQLYDKMFQESLGLLKNLGDGKQRQDAYRSGQVRVPVQ
jgi:hypothetical protein